MGLCRSPKVYKLAVLAVQVEKLTLLDLRREIAGAKASHRRAVKNQVRKTELHGKQKAALKGLFA